MKAILEFNLNDEEDLRKYKLSLNAENLSLFIWELEQHLFRPARKHGYSEQDNCSQKLNRLLASFPEVQETINALEEYYYKLKQDNNIYE